MYINPSGHMSAKTKINLPSIANKKDELYSGLPAANKTPPRPMFKNQTVPKSPSFENRHNSKCISQK